MTPTRSTTAAHATAADVTALIARIEMRDIDEALATPLAIAAAELAALAGVPWPPCNDDPPVATVRLIAKVAARHPAAGGPQTAALHRRLLAATR